VAKTYSTGTVPKSQMSKGVPARESLLVLVVRSLFTFCILASILTCMTDLHPLALEDVFHGHSRTRSKANYYTQHLFLQVRCHLLVKPQEEDFFLSNYKVERTTSPEPMEEEPFKDQQSLIHWNLTRSSSSNGRTIDPLLSLNHAHTFSMKINPFSNFTRQLQKEGEVSLLQMPTFFFLFY
jgi:hypothetical protein